ncbi:MAG: GFA family protein [Gammaproteobacteria bacterium]|nr:GFA family protein [Gammaproteobacteria bacterium]
MITGGCFCGSVRYEFAEGDHLSVNCHCTMCRRLHGAPFVTWLVVPFEQFRYTQGEPVAYASSDDGTRFRCGDCGAPLACVNNTHPEIIDIAVGSLDDPERFPPTREIFADTRLDRGPLP